MELNKEDYIEPTCPLIDPMSGERTCEHPIPQQRVIEKMDEYMRRLDYAGAERHLKYWLQEAKAQGDLRGELMVLNEQVGHYRKTGEREQAMDAAREALQLLDVLEYTGSLSAATTYTNIATMLNSFGENEEALTYFQKARTIYEDSPAARNDLKGGLYNNMALVCQELGLFREAQELYDAAMETMSTVENGELEMAVTCLNRANALEMEQGLTAAEGSIFALLDQALTLLETEGIPHGGYYAYVLDKCYPTFEYYGYFLDAKQLQETAQEIFAKERQGASLS